MIDSEDRTFPAALAEAFEIEFDYADGDGVDFEPFDQFESADETTDWIRSWTGNKELTGEQFRVMGQDGTGGYAAFWLIRSDRPVTEQPVVFLGSEGETGVVARNLADFLWLLADGFGPLEAVEYPEQSSQPNDELVEIAERHAPDARKTGAEAIAAAKAEFPDFEATIEALCR
ncbi:hypothetical protein JOF56_006699 [Kibdelosporangium banguiense]|uniref:SMI1/KNR4 family protein n=1 Tax=Kibdelosporangium banguiense TaxID=1365924 RepID=A0ABS4TPI8_9PSEU|nr:SMI1/KNR4 family protein [Kibdelosporangium banguiense]MBP2326314.1 hypothetical protein [Kibdelosporangium banguiense]